MEPLIHASITPDLIVATVQANSLDDIGYCLSCGAEAHQVEPDARNYECESCGRPNVFGAEEILIGEYFAGRPVTDVDA